ncbi:hypothetical protein K492DRAFT_176073, partial [Lichtheimia hyalospora FSU 10163]
QFGDIKISDLLMAVNLLAKGVDIIAIAIFLLVDINASSTSTDALDFLSYVNIFVCTISSRPGLFVPALFVMHDVSLTPTKKQLLIW